MLLVCDVSETFWIIHELHLELLVHINNNVTYVPEIVGSFFRRCLLIVSLSSYCWNCVNMQSESIYHGTVVIFLSATITKCSVYNFANRTFCVISMDATTYVEHAQTKDKENIHLSDYGTCALAGPQSSVKEKRKL